MSEVVKITISKEYYQILRDSDILNASNHNVVAVDEPDFNYEDDPIYNMLKKESAKAYRKLKNHEFSLRHGNQDLRNDKNKQ